MTPPRRLPFPPWGAAGRPRSLVLVVTTVLLAAACGSNAASTYERCQAPTLAVALVIRIVSGFFSGTFGVVQGVIADITPPQERARNMGYFGAAFNLGFATGPAIGGLLAETMLRISNEDSVSSLFVE